MGALTPFNLWNPEDDLLLKNAVEAGASLESLAKGAVHFSRRFTVRELEERWRSLLYDLNTSTEASARIIEIEIGVSVCIPSKPGRTCNSKVKDTSSGRRKGESLWCHYNAIRKRARSDSYKSANLRFLMPQSTHAAIGYDNSPHDPFELQNELSLGKFPLVHFSDNYGHPETSYGVGQHVYPKMLEVEPTDPSIDLAFHGGMIASIDTELPGGSSDRLYGHPENMSSLPIKEARFNDAGEQFESNLTQKVLPLTLVRNHRSSQSSDVRESNSAFHQLCYSAPLPGHPIWKTIEDVPTPALQMDDQFVEKGQELLTLNCIKKVDDQACDDVTPKSKLNDHSIAALDNATNLLEANFIDFSSSCISFSDDEDDLLLIDVDEEDIGDRSCLNGLGSMFLCSPTDSQIDNLPIPCEAIPSETFDIPASNTEISLEQETIHEEEIDIGNSDPHSAIEVGNLSSSPGASPIENLPNCVLNTEDQDIPCNDDVIFPVKLFQAFPSSNPRQDGLSSLANNEKPISGDSTLVKERKTCTQPNAPNFKARHPLLPKIDLMHSVADSMLESVLSDRNLLSGASRVSNMVVNYSNSIQPAITTQYSQDLANEQDTTTDLNIQVACMSSHTQPVSAELGCVDPLPTMSISDQEDQTFENEDDDDVPNFSDVEAMILDMDLGPYDQESCLFTKEVSRYQCIDTKKTIIRLEQGARSYMNRAISSHGAFAIFYGRHLKYFIRSPEVLIGRETEDIKVDIDLAKEGRANRISRRQAIIKMDENGYFHLKNIGKSSIFVNSKEVPAKKRINLSSLALIEIKDMRFIFDVNEVAVRRHVSSSQPISHGRKSEYEFVYS